MLAPKGVEEPRQGGCVDCRIHKSDAQSASAALADIARVLRSLGCVREQGLGLREKRPAGRREPHAAREALEERDAQLLLQLRDLAAESGLHDGQSRRGPPEMLQPGGGDEVAQMPHFHGGGRSRAVTEAITSRYWTIGRGSGMIGAMSHEFHETIELLRRPASAGDEAMLIELLTACVHGGASIGFLAPLPRAEAEEYWRKVLRDYEQGGRMVLVAREGEGGRIVGTGQLAFEARANGRHRAEVQKLLVLPSHRRRGIAARLMAALEAEARARALRLLFLDTSEGRGGATEFYLKLGYCRAGGIPDYARDPDGTLAANVIFYRLLE